MTTVPVPARLVDVGQRLQAKPTPDEICDAIWAGIAAGMAPMHVMESLGLDPSKDGHRTQYKRWRNRKEVR